MVFTFKGYQKIVEGFCTKWDTPFHFWGSLSFWYNLYFSCYLHVWVLFTCGLILIFRVAFISLVVFKFEAVLIFRITLIYVVTFNFWCCVHFWDYFHFSGCFHDWGNLHFLCCVHFWGFHNLFGSSLSLRLFSKIVHLDLKKSVKLRMGRIFPEFYWFHRMKSSYILQWLNTAHTQTNMDQPTYWCTKVEPSSSNRIFLFVFFGGLLVFLWSTQGVSHSDWLGGLYDFGHSWL